MGILTGYVLWKLKGKEVKMHWVSSGIPISPPKINKI